MKAREPIVAAVLVGLALLWSGCDSSDLFAPSDGQLIISANPSNVVIPDGAGSATSTITVQVFNAGGIQVPDVTVRMSSDGGTLQSAGANLETDSNGIVRDLLTITRDDPSTIEIVAQSGTSSITTTVTRSAAGDPSAVIVASPPDGQEVNELVRFDGSASSDPDGSITCYQWTFDSSVDGGDRVIQDQTTSVVDESFSAAQVVDVILRVSDSSEAGSFCTPYDGAPGDALIAEASLFSANVGSVQDYEICPELSVDLGANADRNVGAFTPSATIANEDQFTLSYQWNCGNGQTGSGATIECDFTETGSFTVSVTVTNQCDISATDSQVITVM